MKLVLILAPAVGYINLETFLSFLFVIQKVVRV